MPKIYILFCLFMNLFLAVGSSNAQYENIWAFGTRCGLDFNNSGPLPVFYPTHITTMGGGASVCDVSGQLLFYTEGDIVWDRNGNRMPGTVNFGQGLTGLPQDTLYTIPGFTNTATTGVQNAMIVPMPDEPGKYYIFSLSYFLASYLPSDSRLYYSVIDMNLNNGLGDVVTGQKGILVDSNLNAKMTGVMGDQCNIWVVVLPTYPTMGTGVEFKAYSVTENGIDPTPVMSNIGLLPGPYLPLCSEIKFSPDRRRLAVTWYDPFVYPPPLHGGLSIFDFDPYTGQFSNEIVLTPGYDKPFFGVEFSPDNSKLYANFPGGGSDFVAKGIFQYDLSSNAATTIINSAVLLDSLPYNTYGETSLKRGPDGKIYYLPSEGGVPAYIGAIHYPNLPGLACQPDDSAILILSSLSFNDHPDDYRSNWYGLPNVVPVLIPDTITTLVTDTLCRNDGGSLVLQSSLSSGQYLWNDSSTAPGYTATDSGIYWVRSSNYCHYRIDSFQVRKIDITYDLGPADTTVCNQSSMTLSVALNDVSCLWQDSTTGNNYTVDSSGIYWVQVTKDGCKSSDTIRVSLKDLRQELGPDIVFCKGDPISLMLTARVPPGSSVAWNTGSKETTIMAMDSGLYRVAITDLPCVGTDSIHIGQDPFCACVLQVPTAFSPNGDGLNDIFRPAIAGGCPVSRYMLNIYNRFGQRIFSSSDIEQGWEGRYHGNTTDAGTYMFEIRFTGGTRQKDYYKKGDFVLIR